MFVVLDMENYVPMVDKNSAPLWQRGEGEISWISFPSIHLPKIPPFPL